MPTSRHPLRRALPLLGVAAAAVAASILLPSVVITIQAWRLADAGAITRFALAVAEPLALLGAGVVAALAARRRARRVAPGARWPGLAAGAAAALGVAAAALWTGDVDRWTAAAVLGLPVVGWLAGRHGAAGHARRAVAPAGAPSVAGPDGRRTDTAPVALPAAEARGWGAAPGAQAPVRPRPTSSASSE